MDFYGFFFHYNIENVEFQLWSNHVVSTMGHCPKNKTFVQKGPFSDHSVQNKS